MLHHTICTKPRSRDKKKKKKMFGKKKAARYYPYPNSSILTIIVVANSSSSSSGTDRCDCTVDPSLRLPSRRHQKRRTLAPKSSSFFSSHLSSSPPFFLSSSCTRDSDPGLQIPWYSLFPLPAHYITTVGAMCACIARSSRRCIRSASF